MPATMLIANFRANCGLDADADWRRFVLRWAGISLLLIALASYFSYGFYNDDEYFQITEFVSYKLGKTAASELPWEFHEQIRPWLQPAVYYCAAKACLAIGIDNPFRLAWVFRIMSGLLGWTAIVSMMLSSRVFLTNRNHQRAAVVILALLWLVPYLAVRTSSESSSGALLAIGVALLALGSAPTAGGRRRFPISALLFSGVCFGLAFECRFQIAFAVIGVVSWVLLVATEDWRRGAAAAGWILLGVAGPIALGTVVDRWGYGTWRVAPWRYFAALVLQHRADDFGVAPVWYYFRMVNQNLLAPITLAWTGATLVAWVRHPRHILTWTTVPFFLAHSLVPHKETRFLFPIVLPAIFFFLLAVATPIGKIERPGWFSRIWEWRYRWSAKVCYALNLVALATVCLAAWKPEITLQKYVDRHYGAGTHAYVIAKKDPYSRVGLNMYFYRPDDFHYTKLDNFAQLHDVARNENGQFLLITDWVELSDERGAVIPPATMVFGTYPAWLERYNYFHWVERSRAFRMYAIENSHSLQPESQNQISAGPRRHAEAKQF